MKKAKKYKYYNHNPYEDDNVRMVLEEKPIKTNQKVILNFGDRIMHKTK